MAQRAVLFISMIDRYRWRLCGNSPQTCATSQSHEVEVRFPDLQIRCRLKPD